MCLGNDIFPQNRHFQQGDRIDFRAEWRPRGEFGWSFGIWVALPSNFPRPLQHPITPVQQGHRSNLAIYCWETILAVCDIRLKLSARFRILEILRGSLVSDAHAWRQRKKNRHLHWAAQHTQNESKRNLLIKARSLNETHVIWTKWNIISATQHTDGIAQDERTMMIRQLLSQTQEK